MPSEGYNTGCMWNRHSRFSAKSKQIMNIQTVLQELDSLFQQAAYEKVEPFLLEQLSKARTGSDKASRLTLLNELMGFYRGMSRFKDALSIADETLNLMNEMGLQEGIPYATTLLNIATSYRADGQTAKAIEIFGHVERIFTHQNLQNPYLYASLYNNLSLAYQETEQHEQAVEYLNKALPLIQSLDNSANEVAVTYTNLAQSKLKLKRMDEAYADLQRAVTLFESQTELNSHYGAALATLGGVAYQRGEVNESITWYERALAELQRHYGKNMYYAITLDNLAIVCEAVDPSRSQSLKAEAQGIYAELGKAS